MDLYLYMNKSAKNVLNKDITQVAKISGGFKDITNLSRPVIELHTQGNAQNPNKFNYFYIPDLHRYYYCDNDSLVRTDVRGATLLKGVCDVLMSYKDAILSSDVEVIESNKYGNDVPKNVQIESRNYVETLYGPELKGSHAILVTCGGSK